MKNDIFTYKCPSCNGKVEYSHETNKWRCLYCNNTYDTLFAQEKTKDLPKLQFNKSNLFSYKCNKCNNLFISNDKDMKICPSCKNILNLSRKFTATNFIENNDNIDKVEKRYKKIVRSYFIDYNEILLNSKFYFRYLECNLLSGYVEVTNNNKSNKYIFVNLIVPNTDFIDYHFSYQIGNAGFKSSDIEEYNILNKKNYIKIDEELFSENKIDENEFVNACIDSFKKKYNIEKDDDIKVNKSLKIIKGIFIPTYIRKIDDETREYLFGNEIINIEHIIELPRQNDFDNKLMKAKNKHLLSKRITTIAFIIIIMIFLSMTIFDLRLTNDIDLEFLNNIKIIFIIITALLMLISFCCIYRYNSVIANLYRAKKLDKKEYLEQIIDNSNYVKVFEEDK
ncbi:MAG: hypothetical protein J6X02_04875 [Bacilli bacterium]|nr:hypothetical protein [Bacilli bacterium]